MRKGPCVLITETLGFRSQDQRSSLLSADKMRGYYGVSLSLSLLFLGCDPTAHLFLSLIKVPLFTFTAPPPTLFSRHYSIDLLFRLSISFIRLSISFIRPTISLFRTNIIKRLNLGAKGTSLRGIFRTIPGNPPLHLTGGRQRREGVALSNGCELTCVKTCLNINKHLL